MPQNQPRRVQIIVLFPESVESEEITPAQGHQAVASNPSFAFLHDPEEDIYTLEDSIAVRLFPPKNLPKPKNSPPAERKVRSWGFPKWNTFSGTFLLVEGDTDKKFYRRFVDQAVCTIVVTSGKPSSKLRVINILKILDKFGFRGALGIVDADFDQLESLPEDSPNVVRTDTHDLETMMLAKDGFEKLLEQISGPGTEERRSTAADFGPAA